MEKNYLTQEQKKYYMQDFNQLLNCKDANWRLDKGLKDILVLINNNNAIQTLYSKYNQLNNPKDTNLSYLEFCYSSKIELELFRNTIPFFISKYNSDTEAKCYYLFHQPDININYIDGASKVGMGCLDDKDYFNINNIGLYLDSKNKKIHAHFWNDIGDKLTQISD